MTGADWVVHELARPSTPGAASGKPQAWDRINWKRAERNVERLQARIVKATQEGRGGKVKALQHLLTRSFSGKALAVRRVTTNRGKGTPGVDGEIWRTPDQKSTAVHELRRRSYRPQPLRCVYIPKSGNKKMRPLSIPVMKDRAMQALYLQALNPIAETTGDKNSYGFRPRRSTADAIEKCFSLLARKRSAQWILEGDIAACFDEISHEFLLRQIPMEKRVLRAWLKAGFMDKSLLHPTEAGTPQGGIASPVLANMALDGLQRALGERFPKGSNNGTAHRVHLVRYADDFIVTGDSKEILETVVKPLVEEFLRKRGLRLSEEKTVITHVEEGFDFLGQTVRKYGGKLLIKPSKKSVHAFLQKVREIIKKYRTVAAGDLVRMLNPVIRGWAQYHRHVVSSASFAFVDHEIWKALWRWALRRHPNKNKHWIKAKYWPAQGSQRWVFAGQFKKADGTKVELRLLRASSIGVRRHARIREDANPFNPSWKGYFATRGHGLRRTNPTRQTARLTGHTATGEYCSQPQARPLGAKPRPESHPGR